MNLKLAGGQWAEACAALEGLRYAWTSNYHRVWLELDSLVLINILKESHSIPWNIRYLVYSIKFIMHGMHIQLSQDFRKGNQVTNIMANWGIHQTAKQRVTLLVHLS